LTTTSVGWLRVNRQNPCPICRKPDWCLISYDRNACICARTQSDNRAGDAGWLHSICLDHPIPLKPIRSLSIQQIPLASAFIRDQVYRLLLAELGLSEDHRHKLLARGLTHSQLVIPNYATLMPYGRRRIIRLLTAKGNKLGGLPGFYLDGDEVCLAGPAGILIPVIDLYNRVVGLQARCDDIQNGKYKWVSSAGLPFGCGSGSPIHVAQTPGIDFREVWITEGPLKADFAATKLKRQFLAVSGVSNWRGVMPIIQELKPERVIVCFDMDKNRNGAVRLHLDALTSCLIRNGFRTFEADWDSHFKGIDDLLKETR
jgi:DNA primase